jgi:hypothetical protein
MPVLSDSEFENFGAPADAVAPANSSKVLSDDEFENFKPQPSGPLSWSDVGSQALRNAPGSAVQFGKNIAQPFMHPIDTANNILDVGHGLAQKLGVSFDADNPEDTAKANAVGKFFADRYGGLENVKKTMASDPVGFLGDLSTVLTGGGGALARAPGIIGKVGEIAGTAGRLTDPLQAVTGPAKAAGFLGREALGVTTGAGPEALRTAAQAGLEGGEAGRAFRENMRGNAPIDEVVADARGAVGQLRKERGDLYRQGMADVGADKTIMSWNDVDTALADMDKVATYKGQSLSPSTEAMRDKITSAISDWKNLRASEFWTPEGFDALKKKVGDLRDASQYGTPERLVADQAYQAIRKTIVDQAPDYARVMKGYEDASKQLSEIERTLSLNPKASVSTALGKLQSALRNNVNTNFGKREELARFLAANGAPRLMEKLAGQALNAWAPRGLSRMVAAGMVEGLPALAAGIPAAIKTAPALATMSPRLMGEAVHGVARAYGAARPLRHLIEPARQVGRAINPFEQQQ